MEILNKIQKELKAPKGQFNSFGKYNYRSCEDILEAVKPLLGEATLTLSDDIIMLGERFYVKATATISSKEGEKSVSAFAREELVKKGMDGAQVTGAASSYARKYALNGLFCIDDTKDADTDEKKPQEQPIKKQTAFELASQTVLQAITEAEVKDLGKRFEASTKLTDDEKKDLRTMVSHQLQELTLPTIE